MAAILGYALELCDAEFGILFEHEEPARFRATFSRGIPLAFQQWLDEQGEFSAGPLTGLGRMAAVQQVTTIVDVRAEAVYRSGDPLRLATADLGGARSFAAIPMLAGDRLVGAFTIYRQRVRPFSDTANDPGANLRRPERHRDRECPDDERAPRGRGNRPSDPTRLKGLAAARSGGFGDTRRIQRAPSYSMKLDSPARPPELPTQQTTGGSREDHPPWPSFL